jgi:5-histidylcysteine sulfoxide synthase
MNLFKNNLYKLNIQSCSRKDILNYYKNTTNFTNLLFSSLKNNKSYYKIPNKLRRPLIFYLGHTNSLYINKMTNDFGYGKMIKDSEIKSLNYNWYKKGGLFERGVNELQIDDYNSVVGKQSSSYKWPSVKRVLKHNQEIEKIVENAILEYPLELPITTKSPWWALLMAIEHERIHFETSSVLIREMNINDVVKPNSWKYFCNPNNNYEDVINKIKSNTIFKKIPAGSVTLGRNYKKDSKKTFGWDNEYGNKTEYVPNFEISKYMISNAEFYQFISSNGYLKDRFWVNQYDDSALRWKNENNIQHPKFWIKRNNSFKYRYMFDIKEMPWDFPVEVNYYEAMAYIKWKNELTGSKYRLITNAEYVRILDYYHIKDNLLNDNNIEFNHNLMYGSPTPIDYFDSNNNNNQIIDIKGNIWEWSSDNFYHFNNFKIHPLYNDFSVPFFNNKNKMLLGGSWASHGTQTSIFYRLWFTKHFYQHAGFRLIREY